MRNEVVGGQAGHRYAMQRDWARLPDGRSFGTTHAVCEDAAGRILIHHTGPDCLAIFAPDGEFLDAWGADFFAGAHGMEIAKEPEGEFLYLAASSASLVVKMTVGGEEVMRLPAPPRPDIYGQDRRYTPTETAVASNGDIYVTDGYGQYWVHRYAADGRYIASFGGRGGAPGQFNNPHGIMIDTRRGGEQLLVSDRRNNRLQYFSLEGNFLREAKGNTRYPCTTVQFGTDIYIPDLRSRVTILDQNDRLIMHLGDWPERWNEQGWPNLGPETWAPDRFSSPHDLHVDGTGNIYVAEWLSGGTGCVSKLTLL